MSITRAEEFLKMYRILEGILEKRYSNSRHGSSVVMDYLRDADSEPWRQELDLCREIRNLLTHNADGDGEPYVEPSQAVLDSMRNIIDYVSKPRYAIEFGTPRERILCAHSNDRAIDIMHRMTDKGYSHVPVLEKGRIIGVFSAASLFAYLERRSLDALESTATIGKLKDALDVMQHGAEKYLFMPENATIAQVRAIFEKRMERNSRTSAVFITKNGRQDEDLLAMLTPWDVLKDSANCS